MSLLAIFLIGVSLAMDAFAVSICKGLGMSRISHKNALILACAFGLFQAGMPVLGWLLGSGFASLVESVDHWIAFILLAIIGGKMIYDGITDNPDDEKIENADKLDLKEVLGLAVATSIDALAIGVTFAFMNVNIVEAALIIGITTFVISLVGVYGGHVFGRKFEKPATIIGGLVLIGIGVKTLVQGLLGI